MNSPRPLQFSIKTLFAWTFLAAIVFWVARELNAPDRSLAVVYVLVGVGQFAMGVWIWQSHRDSDQRQVDHRDAGDLVLAAALLSMPMYLLALVALMLRTLDWRLYEVLILLMLPCVISQIAAFLVNLSAALLHFKRLFDWRLAMLWSLNLANSVAITFRPLWEAV